MLDFVEELCTQRAVLIFSSYQKKKENKIGDASATGKAASVLKGSAGKGADRIDDAAFAEGAIFVQYNPKSLSFGASSADKEKGESDNSPKPAGIRMSVELVFVQNYSGDTGVMDQMELLLSIMLTDAGKHVEFYWGNMRIQGILTSFQGAYDMFDAAGIPISGKMTLGIAVLEGTDYKI